MLIVLLMLNISGVFAGVGDEQIIIVANQGEITLLEENKLIEQSKEVFSDLEDHWGLVNIMKLYIKGGISGYPDGTVKPNGTITRVEFLALASKTIYPKEIAKSRPNEHWGTPFFMTAVQNGIIMPSEIKEETWDNNITRYEMARIIIRFLERVINEEKETVVGVEEIMEGYDEVSTNKDSYYVQQAFVKGVIIGKKANDLFAGNNNGTRAEAATLIIRLIDNSARKEVNLESVIEYDYGQNFKLSDKGVDEFIKGALKETNNQRRLVGVKDLELDDLIIEMAQFKSDDMLMLIQRGEDFDVYFSHESPTYGGLSDLFEKFGFISHAGAENLAYMPYSKEVKKEREYGKKAVLQLKASSGHYQNMINPEWNKIGFGITYHYFPDKGNGYFLVTQTFLK